MGEALAGTSRRVVIAVGSAGAAAAAIAGLAGCEVYGGARDSLAPASRAPASGAAAGQALARTGDVPVGGGLVVSDQQLVITQPTAGSFQGFSAVCTHQGCLVGSVSDGTINCPCHGSRFSIDDGSVVQAAAAQQRPLPAVAITVAGDTIELGPAA